MGSTGSSQRFGSRVAGAAPGPAGPLSDCDRVAPGETGDVDVHPEQGAGPGRFTYRPGMEAHSIATAASGYPTDLRALTAGTPQCCNTSCIQ